MNLTITSLLDLSQTIAKPLFSEKKFPWEILKDIKDFISEFGKTLSKNEYKEIKPTVWVHNDTKISESAHINGPTIIQKKTEIRHCAFIRGSAIIGENCVVGNSTEVKNSILFNNVQIPHFNYVGDSILGFKAHLGAGAIISNVRSDKGLIIVLNENERIITNLNKFGAILGDFVEVGCNAVLNPGTILGKNTAVYPLSMVRNVIPENSIFKNTGIIVKKV